MKPEQFWQNDNSNNTFDNFLYLFRGFFKEEKCEVSHEVNLVEITALCDGNTSIIVITGSLSWSILTSLRSLNT